MFERRHKGTLGSDKHNVCLVWGTGYTGILYLYLSKFIDLNIMYTIIFTSNTD